MEPLEAEGTLRCLTPKKIKKLIFNLFKKDAKFVDNRLRGLMIP